MNKLVAKTLVLKTDTKELNENRNGDLNKCFKLFYRKCNDEWKGNGFTEIKMFGSWHCH